MTVLEEQQRLLAGQPARRGTLATFGAAVALSSGNGGATTVSMPHATARRGTLAGVGSLPHDRRKPSVISVSSDRRKPVMPGRRQTLGPDAVAVLEAALEQMPDLEGQGEKSAREAAEKSASAVAAWNHVQDEICKMGHKITRADEMSNELRSSDGARQPHIAQAGFTPTGGDVAYRKVGDRIPGSWCEDADMEASRLYK